MNNDRFCSVFQITVDTKVCSLHFLPSEEVTDTQSVARVRVHVEHAMCRMKCFHFFDGVAPLTFVGSINQM